MAQLLLDRRLDLPYGAAKSGIAFQTDQNVEV